VTPLRRRHAKRLAGAVVAGAAFKALGGCGFKLRGAVAFKFNKLYADFPGSSATGAEFRRLMRSSGTVELVDRPESADVIMTSVNEFREKEITGFSSTGRPREYQLRLRFNYVLRDAKGNIISDRNEIILRRDVTTTDAQIAARQQEEVLIFREMQTDLVQQLMRRLAAVDPQQPQRSS
jgi:LPS-assembly lipoprotein